MRIMSKHQSPLARQAQEAIQIAKFSHTNAAKDDLNKKSEWGTPWIPQLAVHTPGDKQIENKEETEAVKHLKFHMLRGTTRLRYREPQEPNRQEEDRAPERKKARRDETDYRYEEINKGIDDREQEQKREQRTGEGVEMKMKREENTVKNEGEKEPGPAPVTFAAIFDQRRGSTGRPKPELSLGDIKQGGKQEEKEKTTGEMDTGEVGKTEHQRTHPLPR